MKTFALTIFVSILLPLSPTLGNETILNQVTLTENETYRHASELVAAVNEKEWKKLPKESGKMGFIESIKRYATHENWRGVGAYRKTTKNTDESVSWDLRHHFGYESNFGPHELLVTYRKDGERYEFDHIIVLGW
ncbi:hypothetical protein [Pelagicoccus mobilis]|uniref:DUF4019 domain-containing protein n=1 Tax=Pelagicoccus mobilis TaxID=415221 RepID=A0A934RT36_9BACT|nr:hypothetical protein [Pelagicoccus mobilis]MBK1877090.1 hypothetical protein [Pelagicoccus mobilis]